MNNEFLCMPLFSPVNQGLYKMVCDIVRNVSYKSNWQFQVLAEENMDAISIRVCSMEPASDKPHHEIDPHACIPMTYENHNIDIHAFVTITCETLLAATHLESFVVGGVSRLIRNKELHEMDEWLKYRGKHVKEPHPK